MQTSVTKNNALDFDDEQWSQLINANGLLIMWFLEWNQFNDAVNKDREKPRLSRISLPKNIISQQGVTLGL